MSESSATATSEGATKRESYFLRYRIAPLLHFSNRFACRQEALASKRVERDKRRMEQEALELCDQTDSDVNLVDEEEEEAGASTEAFINDETEDSESLASYNQATLLDKCRKRPDAAAGRGAHNICNMGR